MAKRKGPSEDGSQDPPQERRHSLHGTRTPLVALGGLVLLGAGFALLLVGLARYLEPEWAKPIAPWVYSWGTRRIGAPFLREFVGMLIASGALGTFGWIFFSSGMVKTERDEAHEARLRAHGVEATARLLKLSGGLLSKGGHPRVGLTLELPRPSGPVKVKVSREVPLAMLAVLHPGRALPILLDPHDDEDFIILWERLDGEGEDDDA